MLRLAEISQASGTQVLDNAAGAGTITNALLDIDSQHDGNVVERVIAGDIENSMTDLMGRRKQSSVRSKATANWSKVEVEKIDQQAIPHPDASFTHVFSNFGVFFSHDDSKALTETHRVLKPSGTAGFTTWKSIAWWSEVAQPALAKFMPDAPQLPSPSGLFPSTGWMVASSAEGKLRTAGFVDAHATEFAFTPDVEAEAFAEATGFLVKAVASRIWPQEVFAKFAGQIQSALLQYLQEKYENGKWTGRMIAIITLGKKA